MEILAFEYRRAKSIRTTWITSLFVILAAAAFAYLGTFADDFDEGLDRIPTTDLVAGALLGNPIVIVLIASLGAMAFGHEYRYGTIRLTLTAFPGRVGVFFGKLFTTVALTLFVVALAAVAGYALLVLLGETASGGPSWATVAWQVAVFTLTYALLAFSLTLITRNHPLGIIGPLILFLLEQAVIGLLGPGSSGCRRCCRWPRCSPGSPAWMSLCRLEFGLPGWWVCCWSGWFCCGAATPDATATTWSHYARRMSSNRVTKAVIPAAGLGTRFLPATKATPKEMLPVVDRPAIQYVVEEAVDAGLDDVLIITGRNKSSLEDHFDRNPMLERTLFTKNDHDRLASVMAAAELAKVHYVRQGEPRGLGHAVLCADMHVGEEPFAVLLGDDLIDTGNYVLEQMLAVREEFGGSVLCLMEVHESQIHLYGCAAVTPVIGSEAVKVKDLVEKPDTESAPSNLAVIGRYVLDPAVFDVLRNTPPGRGDEIQLTDALKTLAQMPASEGGECMA